MLKSSTRLRTGWSEAENEALFTLASGAAKQGRPLKSVFDEFAASSGRRPNSVRNYYYARVKLGDVEFAHTPAFVPFTREESALLLREVLSAQARGESVRSCTLRLGGGDDRAMLRYQNKYRSLVRTNPALVRDVIRELSAQGEACFDPYAPRGGPRRAGRPRKIKNLQDTAGSVLAALERVEGLDAGALFSALGTLAVAAVNGLNKPSQEAATESEAERERLAVRLKNLEGRYQTLIGCFRQLIRINTEFLRTNSVVRVSDLTAYIKDLASNVEACEALVREYASS